MKRNSHYLEGCLFLLFLSLITAACSSRKSEFRSEKEKSSHGDNTSDGAAHAAIGGTYCVQTLIQGQPLSGPIHFFNKESQSDGSAKDFESDLSGDKLDVTIHERHPATDFDREVNHMKGITPTPIRDGFAESVHTNHYTRSDSSGWMLGANSVAMGGTPWGLFISKPTISQAGIETVSGFETVKYLVDTTHQGTMDKSALMVAEGLKDYNIVGNLWALRDRNCILQYSIDYEEDGADGKVNKTHYEGGISTP